MSKYTFPNGSAGIDSTLVGTAAQVPSFIVMLLVFVYASVVISGFTNQKRRTGSGDLPLWSTLGGLATTLTALILTTQQGLVQVEVLSATIGITILSAVWLFLSKGRYE